jgi:hypothetical protein
MLWYWMNRKRREDDILESMATISKESLAQFWLNAFSISSNQEYLSFTDATIVENLLELIPEKNEDKKMFDIINGYIREIKSRKIIKKISEKTSPKRRRSAKNTLINIDTTRVRFTVNIEVIEHTENDEEIETKIEGMY